MEKRIPRHVSMIMDGNGRWARERGKERVYGHFEGVESVRACTETAVEAGVEYLSLFAFSEENWGRPEAEVTTLMELMASSMINERETFMANGIRFKVLGNLSRLSDKLRGAIEEMEKATSGNSRLTLIIFLSYSGKWDIMQAAKRLAADYAGREDELASLDISAFDRYLVTAGIPDPDLIVRTSGEQRISNYLLWQSAYSEFYFTDVLWPDFRREQFLAAIEDYSGRDRRYGKVK